MHINTTTSKLLSLILACLMTALMFSACQTDRTGDNGTGDTTTGIPEETVRILMSALGGYTIIRPDDADQAVVDAAATLYDYLTENICATLTIKNDFFREGMPALAIGEFEILVGETNREESAEFISDLRRDDYGYAMIGKKLVIAGKNTEGTLAAVKKFSDDVAGKLTSSDEVFYSSESDYIYRAVYPVQSLKIGDKDISEYRIVYKDNCECSEELVAAAISDTVADICGVILEVTSDKTEADAAIPEILVGMTNRDTEAITAGINTAAGGTLAGDQSYLGYDGTNVRISGITSAAILNAGAEFTSRLEAQTGETVTLSLEAAKVYHFDASALKAMSFNVLVSSVTAERQKRVIQMVKNYMPDTVGYQEVSPSWYIYLRKELGSTYAWVGEGRNGGDSGEYNPICYNKSIFNLIDSGTRWLSDTPKVVSKYAESSLNRIWTYALLERKSDGVKILVVNTHFDHTSDEARSKQALVLAAFLKENMQYPLILTGDFNTVEGSTAYKTVIGSGVTNTAKIAAEANTAATFTNFGAANKIIDFIFVNGAKAVVNKYSVCNEKINGDFPSDHHPVIIEYLVIR